MKEKELRIALVCFGGASLAVYMHGISKEILKLVRASSMLHSIAGWSAAVCMVVSRVRGCATSLCQSSGRYPPRHRILKGMIRSQHENRKPFAPNSL